MAYQKSDEKQKKTDLSAPSSTKMHEKPLNKGLQLVVDKKV
jgi:hypothetical protein